MLLDLDGLRGRWEAALPGCRPIGHELRASLPERWVRFHSLPDSKRYPETSDERAEVLRRHHIVLHELAQQGQDLVVFTCAWSDSTEPTPRDAELAEVVPGDYWVSVLRERDGDYEYWTHVYASLVTADAAGLDALLMLVADDVTSGVIVSNEAFDWLYHPYDGGGDVIARDRSDRDAIRARHTGWLSSHPSGT